MSTNEINSDLQFDYPMVITSTNNQGIEETKYYGGVTQTIPKGQTRFTDAPINESGIIISGGPGFPGSIPRGLSLNEERIYRNLILIFLLVGIILFIVI